MATDDIVRATGERVEALLAGFASAEPDVSERVEELVRRLMELYGAGLARVVELSEPSALDRFAADDLVAGLLALHDLHPVDTETRVQRALDGVRPYLGSHAGGVTLLGVGDDLVVRLRLEGTCDGCPASMVTVKSAIEGAVAAAAPEVAAVEVEGVAQPHDGPDGAFSGGHGEPGFIPLDAVKVCPAPAPAATGEPA